MKDRQIMTIGGVDCYEQDGTAYLRLRSVALGLGFTDNSKGRAYVRWNTVKRYLTEIGFSQLVAKDMFIPENVFYRLAMKAKNETAEAFQAKVADEIIPAVRRHGAYMTPQTIDRLLGDPDTIIRMARELKRERTRREALEDKAQLGQLLTLLSRAVVAVDTSTLIWALEKLLAQGGDQPQAPPPAMSNHHSKEETTMPRECEGYRENLEAILKISEGRHLLTASEVAAYCGIDWRTAKSWYPFDAHGRISAETLARCLAGGGGS